MTRFTHAVVIDFEATCDDVRRPVPQEIIEFPSVLVRLADRATVDTFEAFVRPVFHPVLSAFCTELTGIRQSDVDAARPFAEVLVAHEAWMAGHGLTPEGALLVTCGDWDLRTMLPTQLRATGITRVNPLYARWLNIKVAFGHRHGGARMGMPGMLGKLGLPLVGRHHRGIDDCRNIASILVNLLDDGLEFGPSASMPG